MYHVQISMVAKQLFQSSGYRYHDEERTFGTYEDLEEWLSSEYEGKRRHPMYVDRCGEPVNVGFIISFRVHDGCWRNEEHWISIQWIETFDGIDKETGEIIRFEQRDIPTNKDMHDAICLLQEYEVDGLEQYMKGLTLTRNQAFELSHYIAYLRDRRGLKTFAVKDSDVVVNEIVHEVNEEFKAKEERDRAIMLASAARQVMEDVVNGLEPASSMETVIERILELEGEDGQS